MKRQHGPDNAGMSLIEVIVAVGIFGICAAVLLKGFVTTGYINRTTASTQEATDLAQNLMEEIKAKTFAEVSLAFNYPLDKANNSSMRLTFLNDQAPELGDTLQLAEVLKKNSKYSRVRQYAETDNGDTSKVTASVISENEGITYEFNPRETGENASKYWFTLSGAESGNNTYDALISFDGSTSSTTKYKTGSNTETGLNDYETPNIPILDTSGSALLTIGKDYLEQYLDSGVNSPIDLQLHYSGGDETEKLDAKDVYEHSKRTISITVTESGGSVKTNVKYILDTYSYKKSGGTEKQTMSICPGNGGKHDGNGDCFCHVETEEMTFYTSETGSELKNLFLFYYPNYNSTSEVAPLDNIIVQNDTDKELNLYIAKQKDETETDIKNLEKTYKMSLTVIENPDVQGKNNWNTNSNLYRALTKLHTNLDTNIGDEDALDRGTLNQMSLTYQAVDATGKTGKKVTNSLAKTVLDSSSLDDRTEEDRIYTMEISIYEQGAKDKNFPESMKILTLDGSKEG